MYRGLLIVKVYIVKVTGIMHQYGDCVYCNNHEAPMAAMGIPEFTITNQMWYYNLYFQGLISVSVNHIHCMGRFSQRLL